MSIILPYEKKLETGCGAFITPHGDISIVEGKHEDYARTLCLGPDYDYLTGAKIGPLQTTGLAYYLINSEYEKQKKSIDIFSSSKLNIRELEKLKVWLNNHNGQNTYADFLVYALAYDKVERKISRLITSTATDRHVRFFNYYLMGWKVENPEETIAFESNIKFFGFSESNFAYRSDEDAEAEEEINDIISRVPLSNRPLFFK